MTVRCLISICVLALPVAGGVSSAAVDSVSASQWQMGLRVELAGTHDTLPRLGVAPDASAGYDAAYDVPHPPSPPGDYVELYFPHTGGNWPTLLSTRYASDVSGPASPSWVFTVHSSFGSGPATLQWDTSQVAQLPEGYVLAMVDSGTGTVVLLRHQASYTFSYAGPRSFRVWAIYDATLVELKGQWNLVSVPRNALDMSAGSLFPGAASPAFRYDSAYQIAGTLAVGAGYWLKFRAPSVIAVAGTSVPSTVVNLRKGWNLVGSVDHAVAAPSDAALASGWFTYDGTYIQADSIRPGKGYWIKSSSDGPLVLGGGSLPAASKPEGLALQCRLVICDARGARQTLYVSFSGIDAGPYELPPLPPEEGFDARFSTGTFVCSAVRSGSSYLVPEILVQGGTYPVTLRLEGVSAGTFAEVRSGGTVTGMLADHGVLVINDPLPRLEVTFGAGALPQGYSLSQNYPNPFNPVTRFSYTLPEESNVSFVITDLLGRVITRTAARVQGAGVYEYTIDGEELGLASGIYLYSLEAAAAESGHRFSAARKFMYVK